MIDRDFQVFGYPGLYVMDATVIGANLGANPSLTITALAEHACSRFPTKAESERPQKPTTAVRRDAEPVAP